MKIAELLLRRINQDYFLPSIQREFVWRRSDQRIEKLFDSLLQEYPIGSILVWSVSKPADNSNITWEVYKFVESFDEEQPHNIEANLNGITHLRLVLDGQQRLTALNIGLRGGYSYTSRNQRRTTRLYINLFSNIENAPDNTYGLKYELSFLERPPDLDGEMWFEVGKVLDYYEEETETFKEAFDDVIREKANGDRRLITKAKTTLGQIHAVFCKDDRINEISVDTTDDEKVLNIFVRTNDGGMKLEKADLLLSYMESNKSLFPPKGARQEIYACVDQLNEQRVHRPNFDFAKDDVLKSCLVLTEGLDVQYKLKNFNQDNLLKISANWNCIKTYLDLTVSLIARYGFFAKNIVSKNALIPIAYFLMKRSCTTAFVASQTTSDLQVKSEIIRWLIISQLSGAFGGSSDTTLQKMRKGIDEGKEFKDLLSGHRLDVDTISQWVDKEKYGSRYSHLLLTLITDTKYWDNCHQDHLFPISKFDKQVYSTMQLSEQEIEAFEAGANSIPNLHLLNPSVNIAKGNDSFIDWQDEQNADFLRSSLIPMNIDLTFKNFPNFLSARRQLIINKLSSILIPPNGGTGS